jgi:hypothetical protein
MSTTTTANSPIGHGRQSISKLLRKNEEEMSPKVTGGATVGPQDHEAKDDLAPPAAREGSPLGGVTTIRSFELPDTWYSVNDWFRGVVGWMDAPFVSVCTETRCKNSIELLDRTRTLQKSSGVPPSRSSMVPLPSGANWPSSSRIGYSQNTIMGALA